MWDKIKKGKTIKLEEPKGVILVDTGFVEFYRFLKRDRKKDQCKKEILAENGKTAKS